MKLNNIQVLNMGELQILVSEAFVLISQTERKEEDVYKL